MLDTHRARIILGWPGVAPQGSHIVCQMVPRKGMLGIHLDPCLQDFISVLELLNAIGVFPGLCGVRCPWMNGLGCRRAGLVPARGNGNNQNEINGIRLGNVGMPFPGAFAPHLDEAEECVGIVNEAFVGEVGLCWTGAFRTDQ